MRPEPEPFASAGIGSANPPSCHLLILNPVNPGCEFTPAELGANLVAAGKLARLFHQPPAGIENQGVTAGEDRLGR